jgi:ubiquinone/menaquinone biosynthesis C-methylase UbiE
MKSSEKSPTVDYRRISQFYDSVYYRELDDTQEVPRHLRRLAKRLQPWTGQRLLDVACGTGEWLRAATVLGAVPAGIDLSERAVDACRRALPEADVRCGPAEALPFKDAEFDFVSCLGALEHFLDPNAALREMVRVARPNAVFLVLVPNAGFLPRRLGLYSGTHQTEVKEEVRSLVEWRRLFTACGLKVLYRWRDLHVLSPSWIMRGSWYGWPLRAAQASVLPFWPLSWQYQVYHLCVMRNDPIAA